MNESGQGWAVMLADLSIILFMITAADLSNTELANSAMDQTVAVATAEPVAIYRPGGSMPSLKTWLESQPDDPRQRLTIVVHHEGADARPAMDQAMRLTSEAQHAGRDARMIVERGEHAEIAAILAYDSDPKAVAHKLLSTDAHNTTEEIR